MTYRAPVSDIAFTLKHSAGLKQAMDEGLYGDLSEDVVDAVLEEAGKFASTVIAPLNAVGDKQGTPLKDGAVTMPPGWKEAYTAWAQGGWNGLAAPEEWGGQGLPHALNAACIEMWNSASMAFGIGPVLTMGAIEALEKHGAEALKQKYLAKLTTGEWTGTMQLTEPQAGSDVGALRSKAERTADGTYRITGSKIFITYGEHDLTDNIIHFVLARLPDAPPGTKGHFAIPRAEVLRQRRRLARRAQRCALPFDRAQARHSWLADLHDGLRRQGRRDRLARRRGEPRAQLHVHDDEQCAACGRPAGRRHRGARDAAGLCLCERAQAGPGGCAMVATDQSHPDVRRMLLTMRALTHAARAICYATGAAIDRAQRGKDDAARKAGDQRASLLTPIAKAFSTDIGTEVASLGVQVHGGMGFIEETGAAQHYRDARIAQIYEGTNGIQAIDLVTRKIPMMGGAVMRGYLDELRAHRRES